VKKKVFPYDTGHYWGGLHIEEFVIYKCQGALVGGECSIHEEV